MAAIAHITDFNAWKPHTENTLDLRLAIFSNEEYENKITIQKSEEMKDQLECLYTQASYISLIGYEALVKNCPNIKILNLCCAYKTGDTALKVIARLKNLEELNLHFARNEPVIEYLGTICRVPEYARNLVEKITDSGVQTILENCTQLKKLDLSGTHITRRTLELIADRKSIIFLRIQHCWDLQKSDIEMLVKARPDLQIIEDANDSSYDATAGFSKLAASVKDRYFMEVPQKSGFKIAIKPEIYLKDQELISASSFI